MEHKLKTWPEYFDAMFNGDKLFDIRLNDRHFATGDILVLQEWTPATEQYSGREIRAKVTYCLGLQPWVPAGYVAMGIKLLNVEMINKEPYFVIYDHDLPEGDKLFDANEPRKPVSECQHEGATKCYFRLGSSNSTTREYHPAVIVVSEHGRALVCPDCWAVKAEWSEGWDSSIVSERDGFDG